MTERKFIKVFFIIFSFSLTFKSLYAQINWSFFEEPPKIAYVHAGGSMGVSVFSSSDIRSITGDFKIDPWGFPFSWSVNLGLKNILQFEFKKGKAIHKLWKTDVTWQVNETDINMNYRFEDRVIKFNPIFWIPKIDSSMGYFLLYGRGKIDYLDDTGDGFKGEGNIFGLEIVKIARLFSVSGDFRYCSIKFTHGKLFGIPVQYNRIFKANDIQVSLNVQIGLGY